MKKIKLVASDLDGTLLPEGTPDINPQLFDIIRKLQKKGITFVAASGRQYVSMISVLEPVKNEIRFIADNGAYGVNGTEVTECRSFSEELLREIVGYVRGLSDVFMLVSAPDGAYTDSRDTEFMEWVQNGYQLKLHRVDDVLNMDKPVIKVAMYGKKEDAVSLAGPALQRFEERATVTASGEHWVDFMEYNVDKGTALRKIQTELGITPEETMAFGDNNNDIGLLKCAEKSYAVANARPDVKETARYVLTDPGADAVLNVLKQLLEECNSDICF